MYWFSMLIIFANANNLNFLKKDNRKLAVEIQTKSKSRGAIKFTIVVTDRKKEESL